MIAVIFEVHVAPDRKREYLDIAQSLKQELTKVAGFISIERFQSISDEGKMLSLSYWKDEAAVEVWRNHDMHRKAQDRGRTSIFKDYNIRVAEVVRAYGMYERVRSPKEL
ncbi:MAG: antibiotic biosynthesis monooxygenase [Muricauda sp. TMED12]|nr:MAG: antibiotic biosynthesis monooxygenase [Muricauda sp. TMED12]